MNTPGFSAEAALYRTKGNYSRAASVCRHGEYNGSIIGQLNPFYDICQYGCETRLHRCIASCPTHDLRCYNRCLHEMVACLDACPVLEHPEVAARA